MPTAKQYYNLEEISVILQLIMISLDQNIWDWIGLNIKASPDRLRLSNHGDDEKMFAITQIDCRQRTANKLSETLASFPKFIFDSTIAAQQSTSDSLAGFHSSRKTIFKSSCQLFFSKTVAITSLNRRPFSDSL